MKKTMRIHRLGVNSARPRRGRAPRRIAGTMSVALAVLGAACANNVDHSDVDRSQASTTVPYKSHHQDMVALSGPLAAAPAIAPALGDRAADERRAIDHHRQQLMAMARAEQGLVSDVQPAALLSEAQPAGLAAGVDDAALDRRIRTLQSMTRNDHGDAGAATAHGSDSLARVRGYAALDRELAAYRDRRADMNTPVESGVSALVATGTSGNDVLVGTVDDDTLEGLAGRDTLIGGPGADILDGGADTDTASYASATAGVAVDLSTGTGTLGDAAGDTLISIESLRGSDFDDVLGGDGGNNSILSAGGNDTLNGGGGNDVLVGGPGADAHNGGAGIDWASYSGSTAAVIADLSGGGTGGDAAGDTYTDIERLRGSESGDTLRGDGTNNVLMGAGGDDTLDGRDGDDSFLGGTGADTMIGGAGVDLVSYAAATVGVTVNLQTGVASGGEATGDTISGIEDVRGTNYADVIVGDDSDNSFVTAAGDDELMGGNGDDVLMGGAGADLLDGGAGFDYASYAGSTASVNINLETGAISGGDAGGDTFASIENLSGSAHDDVLIGDSGSNTISGDGGNDTLDGGAGIDTVDYGYSMGDFTIDLAAGTATSTGESDSLAGFENAIGSQGADTIIGDAGRNVLDGNAGNDVINGGAGIDTVDYSDRDTGWIIDLVAGSASSMGEVDVLIDIEYVSGSMGNDIITGNAGDNVLHGGPGADALDGGAGTDVASYSEATSGVSVNLSLRQGTAGDAAGDTYTGIEDLRGSSFADVLVGDIGSNVILSAEGDDTLDGDEGNDFLIGGAGADVLNGGAGKDTAVYSTSPTGVSVDLSTGTGSGGDATGDSLSGIEDLRGTDFADVFVGDDSANILVSAGGNDVLDGRGGNDTLLGGPGDDTFIFGPGYGDDRISGFVAGPGTEDVMDVSALGYTGLSDILASAAQVGTYVIITIDATSSIILIGVNLADLSADDFIF